MSNVRTTAGTEREQERGQESRAGAATRDGRHRRRAGAAKGQLGLPGVSRRPGNGTGWGGRRAGAGRKPTGARAGVTHAPRPLLSPRRPVHITLRIVGGLPRLRRREGYRLARRALGLANRFAGVRICHLSIQGNHLHLIVEADDRAALTRAMRSFNVTFARNLNGALGRRGRVLADRYHVVVLETPSQTRAALAYVLGNWRRHCEDRGQPRRATDRFSTGPYFAGWTVPAPDLLWWKDLPFPDDGPLPIRFPQSWLLTTGWQRGGLLSPWQRPGPA